MAEYKNLWGSTLTFPARGSLSLTLINLDLPDWASQEYDDTDMVSAVKKSAAAPVFDYGEVHAVVRHDPSLAIPLGGADETVRITFPLLTGQSTAGKWEFTGHVTKRGGEKATPEGRAETGLSIKVNSLPVFTAGS